MKSKWLGLFVLALALTLSANVMADELASSPSPADGATNVDAEVALTWVAGDTAMLHYVYLSTDPNLVAAGDPNALMEMVMEAAYTPAGIEWETTYYWRVDEMAMDGAVYAGPVWSFTVAPQVATSFDAWKRAAKASAPTFLATDVQDGIYDIGTLGGEVSYEFVIRSNAAEQEVSMCLMGRRNFGDTQSGLKYEQWSSEGGTKTYGATLFGVADYDYGVATAPGLPTHLVFVASEATQTTALYVNGEYKGSVEAAILLSGKVGIGYGAQAEDGSAFFDNFDGDIFGVAVYDGALSYGEIRTHADAYFVLGARDITSPGDAVVGIPNDGDWPAKETPDLAIDNNSGTKFLHFKGETQTTGFQVTPSLGATVVTGLTLTTANDAAERDPISFEVYGSSDPNSLVEAYELIASGEVVDFNQAEAYPRFTMNATPITFANETAYLHYRVLFTAVRAPASANSMQIAEIELIGKPEFVWFSDGFEAYEAGSDLHGQAGWKGWQNTASAGAPASNAQAFTGTNSVEIIGSADLVHEFDVAGGVVTLSAMQYIPTGSTGTSYFIGMNQYNDAGQDLDWSIQLEFHLDTGSVVNYYTGETTTIVYDNWVEVKCVMDLNNNAVDYYYDGKLFSSGQWDDTGHATFQAIDLFGNSASSVWYDDIVVK